MKVIYVPMHAEFLNELLQQARLGNLILRTADGVEFVLAEIHDFNREIELARENEDLMAFLEARGSAEQTVSAAEARLHLGLTNE